MITALTNRDATSSGPVIVRFVRAWHRPPSPFYAAGDTAGFDRVTAHELIAKGIAELFDAGSGPGVPLPNTPAAQEPWREDPAFAAVLAEEAKSK